MMVSADAQMMNLLHQERMRRLRPDRWTDVRSRRAGRAVPGTGIPTVR